MSKRRDKLIVILIIKPPLILLRTRIIGRLVFAIWSSRGTLVKLIKVDSLFGNGKKKTIEHANKLP